MAKHMRAFGFAFFIFLFAVAAGSCTKPEDFIVMEKQLSYENDITLPGSGLDIPVAGIPLTVSLPYTTPTDYQTRFEAMGIGADAVDEVRLKKLLITVISPEGQTLDFVDSVSVYLSAPSLPEVQIATKAAVPDGVTSVALDLYAGNLRSYVLQDSLYVRAAMGGNSIPNRDVALRVATDFYVKLKPLQ